jgi:hypothetical protein
MLFQTFSCSDIRGTYWQEKKLDPNTHAFFLFTLLYVFQLSPSISFLIFVLSLPSFFFPFTLSLAVVMAVSSIHKYSACLIIRAFLFFATGFVSGVGKGFIRTFKINSQLVGDIVPVDYPINLMIAVGWHTAIQK